MIFNQNDDRSRKPVGASCVSAIGCRENVSGVVAFGVPVKLPNIFLQQWFFRTSRSGAIRQMR
jgi:hypothetical protein